MERHHYNTMLAYFQTGILSWRGLRSIIKILWDKRLLGYVFKNSLFDIPVIGMWLFLREVRPIVPTIRYRNLKLRRGVGGIRPQVVNMDSGRLEMGDSCIIGENVIFNTTPSPGASICLSNAVRDAAQVVKFFGDGYQFDRERLLRDLNVSDRQQIHDVLHTV
jgi:malate dehydrogenase (quinone)